MKTTDTGWVRCIRWLLAAMVWLAGTGSAFAFTEGRFVTTTLEGCRNNGTITLPNGAGKFICADPPYTTGNLGKGWNELDLVPHRLTTSLGSQASATTDYNVYIAGDGITNGKLGWDVVTVPEVNAAKSHASCSVSAGPQLTLGTPAEPFGGGTDTVIYRELTIHQDKGTTCVFDWAQRLALGAHLYPGSSLQSYLAVQEGLSGSKKTISIPVKEILPQSIAKDMTASQGSDHAWDVVKSATANSLSFGDVCRPDAPTSLPVEITVKWTKYAAVPGGPITVITHVFATNPAARTITTTVVDKIYSGTTLLDEATSGPVDVPANTANYLLLTHLATVPAGTTDLNDVATATYTDKVTGVPVPGSTTATASATVQNTGPELNASASIADQEQISGAGLSFSVAAPSLGSFSNYTAGDKTVGPVIWGVLGQTDSGSVTFKKTVYLDGKTVTTGDLSDAASLVGIDGFQATSGPLSVNITSSATATLSISKTYSGVQLAAGEKLEFNFHVSRSGDAAYGEDVKITFVGGQPAPGPAQLSGLTPDTYVVDEKDTVFYPAGCNDSSCAFVVPLQDPSGAQRVVDLGLVKGVATCSGTASYANEPLRTAFPTAEVQKITDPTTDASAWEFKLTRPDGSTVTVPDTANDGSYTGFGVQLFEEGIYRVTETQKTPQWVLTSATPNDGVKTTECAFTVNFPQDLVNKVFQCTFKNTEQGKAKVVKTVQGQPPGATQAFTFQLRQGASTTQVGTTLESQVANAANGGELNFGTWLVPGASYQLCEIVMPAWQTSLGTFVPGSFVPPDGVVANPNVDNSILCVDFTVAAGETKSFSVDNTPPPGGRALTIGFWKNWASCSASGGKGQKPVLDQTLAMAPVIGDTTDGHSTLPGIVPSAGSGTWPKFGPTYRLVLHGSTATPNVAPDCTKAVRLLDKSRIDTAKKMASDPAFNLAAQLVAAELNYAAGAGKTPVATSAINQAVVLLGKYEFNGKTHTAISAEDATTMNSLAKTLDDYNNNR